MLGSWWGRRWFLQEDRTRGGVLAATLRAFVSADVNGYCLELTWIDRTVYHLRGPGGQPAPGAC